MFTDKVKTVEINDYKGLLPCDIVQINQVKDTHFNRCLRAITDNFYIKNKHPERNELAFKTQGNIIFVTFKKGRVEISYKAMPVDKEDYPMIIDNPLFLRALESFIKKEEFNVLFDMSQIPQVVMQKADRDYAFDVAQFASELTMPSVSEMESLSRM